MYGVEYRLSSMPRFLVLAMLTSNASKCHAHAFITQCDYCGVYLPQEHAAADSWASATRRASH